MTEARILFLVLTALMLAILIAIAVATLRKNHKQKLEEPKYRMFKDD